MSRLILIVVIIALVYWLLTAPRRQQRKQEQQPSKSAQDMVSCEQCGLNLPKSESVIVDGKYFCSTEHSLAQKGK